MNNVELPFIREMFDAIAPKYDFLNRSLSLYQDVIWRRRAIASLKLGNGRGKKMLDVACGTCDMAIEAVRRTQGRLGVTATDFSFNMLALGKTKVAKEPHGKTISLAQGNGLALPSFDGAYDAVTIAFGIRNIMDRKGALEEFHRCLKFPSHAEFKAIMTEAGFTDVHARPMTFGIVTLFTGKKG